jgi:hypothetical protein
MIDGNQIKKNDKSVGLYRRRIFGVRATRMRGPFEIDKGGYKEGGFEGDWLVIDEDGERHIYKNKEFHEKFYLIEEE